MREVHVKVIPHDQQRYDTCGDWWWEGEDGETLQVRISDMGNPLYEQCVLMHELTEVLLCKHRSISTEMVDAWDTAYGEGEPGDDPKAPYHKEHDAGNVVERFMAFQFGIDWDEYNNAFDDL
jgi:hypothetical protein